MQIMINGEPTSVADSHTLDQILAHQTRTHEHFAVAVNGRFVPKSAYSETTINAGDQIEFLIPMQGG